MPQPISTIRNDRGPLVATPRSTVIVAEDYFLAEYDPTEIAEGGFETEFTLDFLSLAAGDPTPTAISYGIEVRGGIWHVQAIVAGFSILTGPDDFDGYSTFTILAYDEEGSITDFSVDYRTPWAEFTGGPATRAAISSLIAVPEDGAIGFRITNNNATYDAEYEFELGGHWVVAGEFEQLPG